MILAVIKILFMHAGIFYLYQGKTIFACAIQIKFDKTYNCDYEC